VKRFAGFAAACLTITGLTLGVMTLVWRDPDSRRALWISAAVAFGVQLTAFLIVRAMAKKNVIAGWGLGVALRFLVLGVFALVVAPALGLPLTTALVALAMYLFLSTLVEPLFLKP
jgi:hypothetical protein